MNNNTNLGDTSAIVSYLRAVLADMFAVAGELFTALEEMNNPVFHERAARLTRGMCRIMRTLDNMAYLDSVNGAACYFEPATVNVMQWLMDFDKENNAYVVSAKRNLVIEPCSPALEAELDETLIRFALLNLLSNALLATEPGGTIYLRAAQDGDYLLLTISNHGAGMPSNALSEAEFTTKTCDFADRASSGLGLKIAQEAIRLHTGTLLLATSEFGASVTMKLPLKLSKHIQSHPSLYDLKDGLNPSLTQLSDCLPADCYMFYF